MTSNDKASDPSLTELVSCLGQTQEGKILAYRAEMEHMHWELEKFGELDYYRKVLDMRKYHIDHCPKCQKFQFCVPAHSARDLWTYAHHVVDLPWIPKETHKNRKPKGTHELTLTWSDKWGSKEDAEKALTLAVERLTKYYKDELELFRAVGELTKSGQPHIHIIYRLVSGSGFTDKNLTRAYPHWNSKIKVGKGNQGGHHSICESVSDYAGYIEKHLDTAWFQYDINNAHSP